MFPSRPARATGRALHESLESVAARACSGIEAELVIVGNASSDGTQSIVGSWAETAAPWVTLVREARIGLRCQATG